MKFSTIITIILSILLIFYLVVTFFAGTILIDDRKACKAHLAKLRATGDDTLIRCCEKHLQETQRSILYTPFVGFIFTAAAFLLLGEWIAEKIKSFSIHA